MTVCFKTREGEDRINKCQVENEHKSSIGESVYGHSGLKVLNYT